MVRTPSRRRPDDPGARLARGVSAGLSGAAGLLGRFTASPAGGAAWAPFVATRFLVLATGYAAVLTLGSAPGTVRFRISANELINLAARWDAQWYFEIARDGYHWSGDPHVQQSVVFFPLLPAAMHVG